MKESDLQILDDENYSMNLTHWVEDSYLYFSTKLIKKEGVFDKKYLKT